jgi:hypothetical protein
MAGSRNSDNRLHGRGFYCEFPFIDHLGHDFPPIIQDDLGEEEAMASFTGTYFEAPVTLTRVRWYLAYPLSYRQLEEMIQERGVSVDHSTINR